MDLLKWYYQRRMLNAMVQNSWDEAHRYVKALISRTGTSMGLQYNLALITLGKGNRKEAYTLLEDMVRTYGESIRLCRLLADIAYIEGDGKAAKRWYEIALQDHPPVKEERLMKQRLALLGDSERYAKIVSALTLLSEASQAMEKDFDRAHELYTQILECDPTQVEALNNLGVLALDHFHDKDQAIHYFSQVLELVDNQGAVRNLAKAKKA